MLHCSKYDNQTVEELDCDEATHMLHCTMAHNLSPKQSRSLIIQGYYHYRL